MTMRSNMQAFDGFVTYFGSRGYFASRIEKLFSELLFLFIFSFCLLFLVWDWGSLSWEFEIRNGFFFFSLLMLGDMVSEVVVLLLKVGFFPLIFVLLRDKCLWSFDIK